MRFIRSTSVLCWITGSGLVLALCGFAPHRTVADRSSPAGISTFVATKVQCAGETDLFVHGLKPTIVPFSSTAFEGGGFALADGRIEVPEDGIYVVEANISIRFRGPMGPLTPSIRMIVRSVSGPVAAATGPRIPEEERTTCLSASTICAFKKGDRVYVELATDALGDEAGRNPVVLGENAADVCHLSMALLSGDPAKRK